MMNVIFMDEAMDDMEIIYGFLITAGIPQAAAIVNAAIDSTERLTVFPKSGVSVHLSKEWGEVRDFFSSGYCFRYAIYLGDIRILRVWHQKENERNTLT